jgi:hypothetical protein
MDIRHGRDHRSPARYKANVRKVQWFIDREYRAGRPVPTFDQIREFFPLVAPDIITEVLDANSNLEQPSEEDYV